MDSLALRPVGLIETLRAYGKLVICAFEATGNYHRPIAWRLIEEGLWRFLGIAVLLFMSKDIPQGGRVQCGRIIVTARHNLTQRLDYFWGGKGCASSLKKLHFYR